MIFKRIRRVIRAEKKWIETVRKELSVYSKERYLRYWKIYSGMTKLENIRKRRILSIVFQKLKEDMEKHALNKQKAIEFRKKHEQSRFMSHWLTETRKILRIKSNKANAKNQYETHLKRGVIEMFKTYLEIMRKINADEFLKLGEKQDYFEIGITQVKLHKF